MRQLTAEMMKALLVYDPETGVFTRRVKSANRKYAAGSIAGKMHSKGYLKIGLNSRMYLSHRLAWLYVYGHWPEQIDHINGLRTDNRLANLRLATNSLNQANRKISKNNTSGFKGVSWNKSGKKWIAAIKIGGAKMHLGSFETPEAAHAAYAEKASEIFGAFARLR